jgi:hypothetical protein
LSQKKDFGYQAIGSFKTGLAVALCVWLGQAAVARFLEVGLRVIVALDVTLLVFPPRPVRTEMKAPAQQL